jgi:Ras-related GTP-binding protein A/B
LGVTIDVEQNHVRFLGDLILNLWDCGGQDSFMQSYLSTQASTIFSNVGVMIYVFDLHSREVTSDLEYFRRCLEALRRYSPNAAVFLLVHKMDLAGANRETVFERKRAELTKEGDVAAPGLEMTVFGTSIFDESLYKVHCNMKHVMLRTYLTIIGMVTHCQFVNPQCCNPIETSHHIGRSMQRNRSGSLRAHNIPGGG